MGWVALSMFEIFPLIFLVQFEKYLKLLLSAKKERNGVGGIAYI